MLDLGPGIFSALRFQPGNDSVPIIVRSASCSQHGWDALLPAPLHTERPLRDAKHAAQLLGLNMVTRVFANQGDLIVDRGHDSASAPTRNASSLREASEPSNAGVAICPASCRYACARLFTLYVRSAPPRSRQIGYQLPTEQLGMQVVKLHITQQMSRFHGLRV